MYPDVNIERDSSDDDIFDIMNSDKVKTSKPASRADSDRDFNTKDNFYNRPQIQREPEPESESERPSFAQQQSFRQEPTREVPSYGDDSDDDNDDMSSYAGSELGDVESMAKKRYYISKINALKRKFDSGPTKEMTMNDNLEEIIIEHKTLKKEYDVSNCLPMMRNGLTMGSTAVEKGNSFFSLGGNLDGWAEAMAGDVESGEADDILSDLYEKHYDKLSGWSPEVRLLAFVGQSAVQHHFMKSTMDSMNIGENLKQNPEFMKQQQELVNRYTAGQQQQVLNNAGHQAASAMGGGIQQMAPPPPQQTREMSGPDIDVDGLIGEMEGGDDFNFTDNDGDRTLTFSSL